MVLEKKSFRTHESTIAYFLQYREEFFSASGLTKPAYKNKQEFETLLSQVSIVKTCEKELKTKEIGFTDFRILTSNNE